MTLSPSHIVTSSYQADPSGDILAVGPYKLTIAYLSPTQIDPGTRFRQEYADGGELENSIREHGILQSLVVLHRPNNKYLLLAGGRRLHIATRLQLQHVPVLISLTELDELTLRTIEMVENLHRRPLTYEEDLQLKAKIHQLQVDKFGTAVSGGSGITPPGERKGWRIEDTAQMLGVSKGTISQDLKLAAAIERMPELRGLKDKKQAAKVLEGMIKTYVQSEKADEYNRRMATDDGPKRKLCDSYIVGDFFEKVKLLPNNAFDFVELDPFYGIELLDLYALRCGGSTSYTRENYTDVPPEVYEWYIRETLRECYRVMADNSWGICWFAMEPWFEPTYRAICDAGFTCRRVAGFWIQPTGAAYRIDLLLASAVDSFFYFRKGQPTLNTPGTTNAFLCGHVPPSSKIHPTERPIELYLQIIPTFVGPGSRMFVPFVGSGNQLLAASNLQVSAVGFDLCADYKSGFVVRVNEGEFGHYKSFR